MSCRVPDPPEGFRSQWRTIRGLRVHGLESAGGHGPVVDMLPGLVTASRSMVPLARALISRGVRVRILDPPGFGYSDKPPHALSVNEQATMVAEWLAADGRRPGRVLGNSLGSQVAAAVAASHPQVVGRLVLLSPTVSPHVRRRLSWLRALPVPGRPRPRSSGRCRARILGCLHSALGDEPPLRILNVAEYGCASLPRAAGSLRGAIAEPIEDALPRVHAPALVIRGNEDRLSSLEWAERLLFGTQPSLDRLPLAHPWL